jgi:hypothetical protein
MLSVHTKRLDQVLLYLVAGVWLMNGLVCKVLNLVPSHQEIVAVILGEAHAPVLTKLIGVGEILLGGWVLSRLYRRLCAVVQITLVMVMNILESVLVPEMLLWGRLNIVFALLFCALLYWQEFVFRVKES